MLTCILDQNKRDSETSSASIRPHRRLRGDTDHTPLGLTGGSLALAVAGVALYEASRTIIGKARSSLLLEVSAAASQRPLAASIFHVFAAWQLIRSELFQAWQR